MALQLITRVQTLGRCTSTDARLPLRSRNRRPHQFDERAYDLGARTRRSTDDAS